MKSIAYSTEAAKVLRRMPANTSRLIRDKIEQYASDPKSLMNNVKKLQGCPGFRLRVGDWRVILAETKGAINVLVVRPRGGAYD